jgi:hypothetical protein
VSATFELNSKDGLALRQVARINCGEISKERMDRGQADVASRHAIVSGRKYAGREREGRSKGKIKIHDGSVCRRRLKCPVQSLETFAQRTQPRDPEAGNIPRGSRQGPAESSYAAGLVRPFNAFSLNLKSTLRMAEMMKPAAIASRPIPRDDWVGSLLEGNKWCQKNKRLFVVPR